MVTAIISRESIIRAGDLIQQRVAQFREKAKSLFYAVMLFQKECCSCGSTRLVMTQDGCCRCLNCRMQFDPTVKFQTCPDCNCALILKIHHYWCPRCRHPVRSLFCFDKRVFDREYFRDMMQESRRRRNERVQELQAILRDSRSPPFWPENEPVLEDPIGFAQDLESFLRSNVPTNEKERQIRPRFDINAYRRHILGCVSGCVADFEGISTVVADPQLDRVYRFITVVFLDHEGLLEIMQDRGGTITLVGT